MRNHSLDTLKFICAILVICIHTPQPLWLQPIIDPLQRSAVPIFFMISGYFTYGANLDSKIRKRVIYILKIFGISFLLYLLQHIIHSRSLDFINIILYNIKTMILYNEVMFGCHLWYIPAYLYVLIIVWLVNKYKLFQYLYYAVPPLLIAGLYFGKYHEIITGHSHMVYISRNFLFTGLPFFAIGLYIKNKETVIKASINRNKALIGFIVCYCIGLVECLYLNLYEVTGDMYITTTFAAIFLFVYFLNGKQVNENCLSITGRYESLYIYMFHGLIITEIYKIILKVSLDTYWPYISTITVLFITMVFIKFLKKTGIIGKLI